MPTPQKTSVPTKKPKNPKHEQHEEMLEWIGGEFDPEAFELEAVNKELAGIR